MIENVVCARCVEPFDTRHRISAGVATYVCPRCQSRTSIFANTLVERFWRRVVAAGLSFVVLGLLLGEKAGPVGTIALVAIGLALFTSALVLVVRCSVGMRRFRRASSLYDEKLDERRNS
jgi:hypothetical protein